MLKAVCQSIWQAVFSVVQNGWWGNGGAKKKP
jgi:hypothetical protein